MTTYRFDRATAVSAKDTALFEGDLLPAWNIGRVPNGGYQLAVMARAARETLNVPDILNATAYYIGPSSPGVATLPVEVMKQGRSTALAEVRLIQEGRENVRAMILGGDLTALRGPDYTGAEPPALPPVEKCARLGPELSATPAIMAEVELYLDPATAGFMRGETGQPPTFRAWAHFVDDRPIDALSLICLADVLPPTSFNLYGLTGWVPTLELTVQVRRRPAPGSWVRMVVTTRHVTGGHFEEDGEIWDGEDRLVAVFRQRALLLQR